MSNSTQDPLMLLTQACQARRLLLLWADVPFPPLERLAQERAAVIRQWQQDAAALAPAPEILRALPALPVLSLDPTARLETASPDAHCVVTRRDVTVAERPTVLKLAGDLATRAGLWLTWDEVAAARSDPDKAHLLAEARRAAEGGVILALVPRPGATFLRLWETLLAPIAQAATHSFVLGPAGCVWPPGMMPLEADAAAVLAALRVAQFTNYGKGGSMSGISAELLRDLRTTLLNCGLFDSDSSVSNLFTDARISPWRDQAPSAGNPAARVSAVVSLLSNQFNTSRQNALALFLRVLSEQFDPADARSRELERLAGALEREINSVSTVGMREKKMSETYVDFDLHIAPDGRAIARSPEGESPVVTVAVAAPNAIQLTLNLVAQRQTNGDLIKQIGRELYAWLFPGPLHTHFQQTEAVARAGGAKVRLRLRIEADALASLPLEFAYRDIGGYFLATNPDTVLSRYLNLPLPPGYTRRREGPLHVLLLIAAPSDQGKLDPVEWEKILRDALAGPLAQGKMTLTVVPRATRRAIRDALLQQKPDIVQFVGHGTYQNGKGALALVQEDGTTWGLDDECFAALFAGYDDHLGLVSLATCESAKSDAPQGFLGIAPKLVQKGIPAVVAMQYSVLVKTAKIFLEEFYVDLAARKPVDWAVQQGRNAIALELGLDNREFATPVLYMRAENGEIF